MKTDAALTASPMALSAAQRVGEAIAQARKRRGLTQSTLATQAGLSKPTLQRLEQGAAQISATRLFDLLDALDPQLLQNVVSVVEADAMGRDIQAQRLPERVRRSRHDF
jgi:transcriptional regulator with XRE-family HTH domain